MFLKSILDRLEFLGFILLYFWIAPPIIMLVSMFQCNFIVAHKNWSNIITQMLKVNFHKLEGSTPIQKKNRTMLLVNHRSWGDFFTHDQTTEYTANFVSRMAVAIIFPSIYMISYLSRSIWFFKRGGKDPNYLKNLFKWFSKKWDEALRQNVLIYPEGHRMYNASKPAFLKKGMIKYAFDNKIDVQIVITVGNDEIMNERQLRLKKGIKMTYAASEVIKTDGFSDSGSYYDHIVLKFGEQFSYVQSEHDKSK